jgi:hypothetical protein
MYECAPSFRQPGYPLFRGPVVLRPQVTPGLQFSKEVCDEARSLIKIRAFLMPKQYVTLSISYCDINCDMIL